MYVKVISVFTEVSLSAIPEISVWGGGGVRGAGSSSYRNMCMVGVTSNFVGLSEEKAKKKMGGGGGGGNMPHIVISRIALTKLASRICCKLYLM